MKTITHRELRNQSSSVLRDVARGESYAVTNHGEVVARLTPPASGADLRCVRPARTRPVFGELTRHRVAESVAEVLDDLRGDR